MTLAIIMLILGCIGLMITICGFCIAELREAMNGGQFIVLIFTAWFLVISYLIPISSSYKETVITYKRLSPVTNSLYVEADDYTQEFEYIPAGVDINKQDTIYVKESYNIFNRNVGEELVFTKE